ncbi:MAG: hypothetical protein QMD25_02235 [Caldisericia bacterium]|jgi:hypothetical protein|nr:hypothetical protein [Caldisericia bacterium]
MLNKNECEIKIYDDKIELISKIEGFVIIDFNLFKSQIDDKIKIKFFKENFVKEGEKFFEIEINKDSSLLKLKVINLILNSDFINLSKIKESICSIILIKEEIDIDETDSTYLLNLFKKYKIYVDEINITIPEEDEILSSINDLIVKSDFILILFEEKLKERVKKYLKDFGSIVKILEFFVLKKQNKKIIVTSVEKIEDFLDNILKEVYL